MEKPEISDLIKDHLLKWAIGALALSFGLGFFSAWKWLQPEVAVSHELEMQRIQDLNDRLEDEIQEQYLYIDSTDAYIEKISLDWQYEDQQSDERNDYQIPAEARRINSASVDSQLIYIKRLRDRANERK